MKGEANKMEIIPKAKKFKRKRVESSENLKKFLCELNNLKADENNFTTYIEFTHDELEYIRNLGYSIRRVSLCLQYEVSF